MRQELGFTLIELLVTITILGVLTGMSISFFSEWKQSAGYSGAEQLMRNMQTAAEAGLIDTDNPPAAVPLYSQNTPGVVSGAQAATLLTGLQVPKSTKMTVEYDPSCILSACQQMFLESRHCLADEHLQVIRFGDGLELRLANITGGGC